MLAASSFEHLYLFMQINKATTRKVLNDMLAVLPTRKNPLVDLTLCGCFSPGLHATTLTKLVATTASLEALVCTTCADAPEMPVETKYYLELNRHGRAWARDFSTSKPDFVEFLARCGVPSSQPCMRHSVLYGFLRENPAIWTPNGEKIDVSPPKRGPVAPPIETSEIRFEKKQRQILDAQPWLNYCG
jgi:hypothetical protein